MAEACGWLIAVNSTFVANGRYSMATHRMGRCLPLASVTASSSTRIQRCRRLLAMISRYPAALNSKRSLLVLCLPAVASGQMSCSCLQRARKLGFWLPEPSELAERDAQIQSRKKFPPLWDAAAWVAFTALGGQLPQPLQGDSDCEYSTDQGESEGESGDDDLIVVPTTEAVSPDFPPRLRF